MIKTATKHYLLKGKGIYCIAGICKNSGKTSFLNYLIQHNTGKRLGILTTGRDGETKDCLFGTPKPQVKLPPDTLFTTDTANVDRLGAAVEVLDKLPLQAGSKALWLVNSLRKIETEIIGPASAAAQLKTASILQSSGAEVVLIDGSLDRKSVVLNAGIKGVFLIAGGSYGSISKILAELSHLVYLSSISLLKDKKLFPNQDCISLYSKGLWKDTEWKSLLGNELALTDALITAKADKLYLPTAITDAVLNALKPALKDISEVIVKHPLHLHLTKNNLEYLQSLGKLYALERFNVLALALNSWSVEGNHLDSSLLRQEIRRAFPKLKVIDIYEAF